MSSVAERLRRHPVLAVAGWDGSLDFARGVEVLRRSGLSAREAITRTAEEHDG